MLFGSLVILFTALALLAILFFPFRLRIRYRRSEGGEQEFSVMIRFRAGVHPGWEITAFRYTSDERTLSQPEPQEDSPTDRREERTPLHILLHSVNLLQTHVDGGRERTPGQSLPQTLLDRVSTPMRFLQYVRDCEALRWETRFGTGDAASTAVLYGVIWGLKATAYTVLARWVRFRSKPYFIVVPEYDRAVLAVAFDGIFRFRLGQIILVETLAMLRKWKKGVGRIGVRQETSY